jgi:methylglutaconyl-CoA hydratase
MKYLKISEEKKVMTIALSRPEVRNAFHPEMIQEITNTFKKLSKKSSTRVVVLKGEGKVFCAGADLQWMQEMVKYSLAQNKKDATQLFEMMESIWNCPLPVIAAVHGAAFGGALGLLACADYVLCEEKTQLCFSEVKLGLSPAIISAFLIRKFSAGSLQPLMTSGRIFSCSEAWHLGLVSEEADEESFGDCLEVVTAQYLQAGPEAISETKKLLNKISNLDSVKAKAHAVRVISERRVSAEGQEGLTSFLQKREPKWRT